MCSSSTFLLSIQLLFTRSRFDHNCKTNSVNCAKVKVYMLQNFKKSEYAALSFTCMFLR